MMLNYLSFSFTGLVYLLMLFIPNMIWTKYKPAGYETIARKENKLLLVLERTGQVLVVSIVLFFNELNIDFYLLRILWLCGSIVLMLLYEICWVRYFKGKRTLADMYGSFTVIPVPLALLPVIAFLLLGIFGNNLLLIFSTVILGIGHIGIHIQHKKFVNSINMKIKNKYQPPERAKKVKENGREI